LRLLFLGLNYTPELTGIGKYSGEMMEWLAARGHEVRVVTTPPYYPAWRVSDGHTWWRYSRETSAAGAEVYRCPLWVPAKPGGLSRVVHLSSFAVSSVPVMLTHASWRPDMVLTIEPAFTCAPVALLTALLAGSPAWLHIQDFEIDAAFDLGLLPAGGVIQRFALWYERALLRGFSRVSTISPRMVERLAQKGVEAPRAVLFPNWVDVDAVRPMEGPSSFRAELGIRNDQIVLLYSGNMSVKQGLEILPQLATRLREEKRLHFIFCGDGAYRAQLEQAVAGLRNVSFLPLQPLERLNDLLNSADIHLLPQRAGAADLVMPSKLTGMLASGRPVIATAGAGTQIADVVEGHGLAVAPGDVEAFANASIMLAGNDELRRSMGRAARAFAEQKLARDAVLLRLESTMKNLAGDRTAVVAAQDKPQIIR